MPGSSSPLAPADANPYTGIFPPRLAATMGPTRLILGERVDDYRALLDGVVALTVPATIVDWLNVAAYTAATWDGRRLQRLRDASLRRRQLNALATFLEKRREPRGMRAANIPTARDRLTERFTRGDADAHAKVVEILARHGRSLDEFAAEIHFAHSKEFGELQALLIAAIASQQRALRDLEERSGTPDGGRWRLSTPYTAAWPALPQAGSASDPDERIGRRPSVHEERTPDALTGEDDVEPAPAHHGAAP